MHVNWRRGERSRRLRNDHGYRHGFALHPWKVDASHDYRHACRHALDRGDDIFPRWRRSILWEAL